MSRIDAITRRWIRNKSDELAADRGYFFDEASGQHIIDFATKVCCVTLYTWQDELLRRLFGWRAPDGTRRFTRGYISMAKKNGKTLISSVIVLYILVCERGAGVSAANSRNQASEVFRDMEKAVKKSRRLSKILKVIPSTKTILFSAALATYHAMSADANTGDGVRAKLVIYDEYHRAKDTALYEILKPAGEGEQEPLFLVITTSGDTLISPCGELYEYAKRILAGNLTDDAELQFFVLIFEAEEEDDPGNVETWRKANPSLGKAINLSRFRADYLEAKHSPSRLASFQRLRLNRWVSTDAVGIWLNQDHWSECAVKVKLEELRGADCFAALDLSSTTDITALLLMFRLAMPKPEDAEEDDPEPPPRWLLIPYFFMPRADMALREKRDGCPYFYWAEQPGLNIDLTPGNVIDYGRIRHKLGELRKVYNIKEIAVDRWNATHFIQELTDDGFEMVPFGQGFGSMTGPSKEFERMVLSHQLAHPNHPLLNFMASKCVVATSPEGNIKPDKRKSSHRIDGIVASIMCVGRMMAAEGRLTESLLA